MAANVLFRWRQITMLKRKSSVPVNPRPLPLPLSSDCLLCHGCTFMGIKLMLRLRTGLPKSHGQQLRWWGEPQALPTSIFSVLSSPLRSVGSLLHEELRESLAEARAHSPVCLSLWCSSERFQVGQLCTGQDLTFWGSYFNSCRRSKPDMDTPESSCFSNLPPQQRATRDPRHHPS